jgi:hypothetical protein
LYIEVGIMAVTHTISRHGITVPVLHKIYYGKLLPPGNWRGQEEQRLIEQWLSENCQSAFYHSPVYLNDKFIEFEDDAEATLFALRWVK